MLYPLKGLKNFSAATHTSVISIRIRQLEEHNDLTSQVCDVDATVGNSKYRILNLDDYWIQWICESKIQWLFSLATPRVVIKSHQFAHTLCYTPVVLPRKPHGWRSLVGFSPWGRYQSDATERLHFHFSLSRNGKGNGNPLQCSCLENPRDGRAWWAAVCGVAQSQTRLKRLSSSSSSELRFHMQNGAAKKK